MRAAALLAAARAVLENRAFAEAAKVVLEAGRTILGADAGLVAVCSPGGENLEIVHFEAGSLALETAAGLPGPLRALCTRVAVSGESAFDNDLSAGTASSLSESTRSTPVNALIAPILLGGEVAGLLGLIDRPGGFSAGDSRFAELFAGMSAAAILQGRAVDGLERTQDALETEVREGAVQLRQAGATFQTLVESLPDIIARFDRDLRPIYVSPATRRLLGSPQRDLEGRTNPAPGMPAALADLWAPVLRMVFASGMAESFEFTLATADGTRHFDSRLVPETGPGPVVRSVLAVARDVTERWLALESERHARGVAEELREATIELTRSLDREVVLVTLLDRLRQLVPFDRASVLLIEEASRLSVRAVFDGQRIVSVPPEERPEFEASQHPVIQGILTSGAAVMIPNLRAHPEWKLPTEEAPEGSWMGVPLFARGTVAGLVSLGKLEADAFSEEQVRLAEAMSSQASVAVENAVLFAQMQASTLRMHSLARRLVEAQESERRSIARELHDEAGQSLASLRIGLRLLEREIAQGGEITGKVAELVRTTDAVIDGLHRLAADLRPASLDHLGLDAALRQYAREAASKYGLAVHFKARGFTEDRLPAVVETALYRVVQEAMTNVVRHAEATRVDILVEHRGDRVMVMVEDDGVGFDPMHVGSGDHLGLLGLQERAEALGGTLTLESVRGVGTTIVVEVASADPNSDR